MISDIYRMPYDVACKFIKEFTQPTHPTLGVWLGWDQPYKTHPEGRPIMVKLGSAECKVELDVEDVLEHLKGLIDPDLDDDGYGWGQHFDKIGQTVYDDLAKEITAAAKKEGYNKGYGGRVWTPQVYLRSDEVWYPFLELDDEDQVLYRLAVMMMNTVGTEGHDWSSSYIESLGQEMADHTAADCKWEVAEVGYNKGAEEIVERLLELDTPMDKMFFDDMEKGIDEPQYLVAIFDWLRDTEEGETALLDVFPDLKSPWIDVCIVMAYAIQWIQELYEDRSFIPTITDDTDPLIADFLQNEEDRMRQANGDVGQPMLFDIRSIPRSRFFQVGYNHARKATTKDSDDFNPSFSAILTCEDLMNVEAFESNWEAREWLDGAQYRLAELAPGWWL